MTSNPTNGIDVCPCGCKYWTVRGRRIVCFDCSARFEPPAPPHPTGVALDQTFIDSVEDVLIFQFDVGARTANAMAKAIVEALEG